MSLPKYLEKKIKELIKCCTKALQTQVNTLESNAVQLISSDSSSSFSHVDAGYLDIANISETVEAGDYKISWSLEVFEPSGGDFTVRLQEDASTIVTFTDTGKTNYFPYSGFQIVTLTAGSHDFELAVNESFGDPIEGRNVFLTLEKIA